MSITLKRWEPETDYSRLVIREAAEETRRQDLTCSQKQEAYANHRQAMKALNPIIDIRSYDNA